jgi:integrase
MDSSIRTGTPLRQRMIDDMRMRKLEHKTQAAYIRAVRKLAAFLRRSPDSATVEDLRRFQLHLVDQGSSPITLNATLTGLKFFFEITLDRPELMAKMQPVRVPRTLPVILSREEVARLIAAAPNLKSQTALSIAYGAGLRASEVIALKVGDIDSKRMTLRVEQGKGRRTAMPCSHGPTAQPRDPCRRGRGSHRQARVDALATPLCRVPDYAE